jgi:glycosyltransferase involved in cell wall biosynthesis
MKRVLIFSLAYYPRVGGAEVAIKEITDRIAREDIAFDMITLRFSKSDPDVEMVGNVRVYRVKGLERLGYIGKALFPLLAAVGAYGLHKKFHYDGAWAMMSYMVFPLVLLRFVGVRIPYVLNLQDGDPFKQVFSRWFVLPLRPLLIYGFRQAAVIQPLSTYLVGWARAVGYKGPIEIIPNGANCRHFANANAADIERRKIEIGKTAKVVGLVSTSRLVHKNALDDCIRALASLPDHMHFYNFGFGPDKKYLESVAREAGVGERTHFLPHPGLDTLPQYLHACDIFIRPSRTEGFGVSFIEAMAAGLPIIATQEGGIADFLFDAKRNPDKPTTGFAVDKDSPTQIARAVEEILSNPEATKKVIEQARELAFSKYDWDLIARDMRQKVFAKVLA